MELTAESIAKVLDGLPSKDSVEILLQDVKGLKEAIPQLADPRKAKTVEVLTKEELAAEEAELNAGAMGAFGDLLTFEFNGIPIGQAAVGGFAAIFASELVDGFAAQMSDWQRGLIKIGVAWASVKWGKKLLGNTGSKAIALLLTFDALRDLSPLDTWADNLAEKISGTATTAGLAGDTRRELRGGGNGGGAGNMSVAGYYGTALGGGK